LNRRKFLKYAGATVAVVGASALGLDYFLKPQTPNVSLTTTATSSRFDYPPVIDSVDVWPKYINPTDAYGIRFTETSHDPDGDPLTATWLIDGVEVSHANPYVTTLPVGVHTASVQVSDDKNTVTGFINPITVEPDQLSDPTYQPKPFRMEFKGMDYAAGRAAPELNATPTTIPSQDELDEQLDTIHNELGCNAISVWAGDGYEDNLIEACKLAMQKGFDRIYVLPKYMHFTVDEIAEKLENLAPRITSLRETSDKIVWAIGNEFTYCVKDLIPGDTLKSQQAWVGQHHDDYILAQQNNIPQIFERILPVIKGTYDYPVAYNAEPNEIDLVPWSDTIFESVGWNAYLAPQFGIDEKFLINKFSQLGRFGKPIIVSEFGSETYTGALIEVFDNQPYDEDEQARNIKRYCDMLNSANTGMSLVTGAFPYIYNEEWPEGWGFYNGMQRKKGFYMYKSYQRAS